MGRIQNHVDENEEIRTLKAQVYRLKKELDNVQVKAELYNEMINVAERHFNIRIRKKLVPSSIDLRTKDVHRCRVVRLCRLLGVTKQAYYKYDEKKVLNRIAEEEFVIQFIFFNP